MINKKILIALICSSVHVFAQKVTTKSDSISMQINEQNTIYVKAVFNKIDTIILNFDTGTTELILTNDVRKHKLKTEVKLYDTPYDLEIGSTVYQTKVYDAELTGHGTDGRFGWDLFKNKIVELNYDKNLLVIHSTLPEHIRDDKAFSKLDIEFYKDLFLVKAQITQDKVMNRDLFLFDTGYQRTAMLDNNLLAIGKFPTGKMEVLKKVIMKGAQGNEIPVITANLQSLEIGKYLLKNVPVQQTTTSKPLRDKNVHILGNEVLKRFNTFLDFQHNLVYLKPNHLYRERYVDQKKTGT
jgi:hypothetical protein